ncbi:MAG: hypothetical protein JNL40_05275 [Cyclobacteriaceae bacterium]|nr:hypothetical protein [Cyclobacteriaceae bacterium]
MFPKSTWLVLLFLSVSVVAVKAQSKKWKALAVKADTLYNREEYGAAVELYTKILNANPPRNGKYEDRTMYGFLYKRAVSYYSIQEYDKALADVILFEPQYPRSPQPKLLKAFIYRELDDLDKQLENLSAAMALQPANPDFLKWRGKLYIQKQMYSQARKDLMEARQFEIDAELETYLGLCYYHTGQRDSAYISFNHAIELNPTFMATYLYAGSMALEDGNFLLGLEYVNLALRLDGKNPDLLYYKGVALIELNRTEEGCRCLNRAFYAGSDDAADYLEEYCFGGTGR